MRAVSLVAIAAIAVAVLAACGGSKAVAPPTGRIAFTSNRDGDEEIYTMNADGTDQVNLTKDPKRDAESWWSSDGTQIGFQSFRGGGSDIYIMDADGANPQPLTSDAAVDGGLRWSPDGTRVAFYSFVQAVLGFMWVANSDGSDGTPVLQSIHPAGPEVQCAGGFPGAWFPDGERILYRGSHGESKALQICSANADGSDIQLIFSEPNTMSLFPALSPDGTRIAFVSNRDGNGEIYVIDADGKNLRRVTKDEGEDSNPTWSPDGEWIAFASNRDGDLEIYVVRPDGKGLLQLTDNPTHDSEPAWSPS